MSTPPIGQRAGAHRPRRPLWQDILPVVAVLVAVLALGYGVLQIKNSTFGSSATSTPTGPVPTDDPNPPGDTTPTTTSSSHPATSTKSVSPTSSATTTASTVDHAQKVSVYNATSRSGLAKGAAAKLVGDGWKAVSAGNEKRFTPPGTTVYYSSASLLATAQAVAKDLGGYRVKLSSTYGPGTVSVVLGSDYTP